MLNDSSRFLEPLPAGLPLLPDGLLDDPGLITQHWMKTRQWVAIPSYGFLQTVSAQIALAIQETGNHYCIAVATESLMNVSNFRVKSLTAGITAFCDACDHYNFLLTTRDHVLAVLKTTSDFYVVAGSQTFVERAMTNPLDVGREKFRSQIIELRQKAESLPDAKRTVRKEEYIREREERLLCIAEYYEQFG